MSNHPPKVKVTWAQMVRDVFIAAINRGQFLTAILGLILVIIAWRLPTEDLSAFVKSIIESLKTGYLLGYVLFILAITGWFIHSKRLRRLATFEQTRIGDEKTKLQKIAGLGKKVKSSK